MKIAVYPGSFNPYHAGHHDIIAQALMMFDFVIIAVGVNPDKPRNEIHERCQAIVKQLPFDPKRVEVRGMNGFLKDFVKGCNATAVIKGLRNPQDFEYEKAQQYWNEDLGMNIPTVYIISDRKLVHLSSSAFRAVDRIRNDQSN